MVVDKWHIIIETDAVGDPKPTRDVISDEISYSHSGDMQEGYSFGLLGVAFCSS